MALLTAQQQVVLEKKKYQMMRLQHRLDYSTQPTHMLQMEWRSICRGNAENMMHALAGNEWRMGNAVAVRGCSHFKCSPGFLQLLYSAASFSKRELACSEQHIHPAHTQIGPSVANASFHCARFLSRHSLTHTYTQICSHRTPFLSSHPLSHPLSPICPWS